MGIFDIFTNQSAKDAAAKNAQLYQQYGSQANAALAGYGAQAGDLFKNYGAEGNAIYGNLGTTGNQIIGAGTAQGREDLTNSITPFSNLSTKYGGATSLYLDALGINGPAGVARARAAFQTGPGYEFQVNQATDAAARNAAKLGLAGSGNALDAIREKAQNVANTEYGGYLDRLGGFVSPELQAAGGVATGYRSLADLASTDVARRLGLAGTVAGGQADILGTSTAGQAKLLNDLAQGRIGIAGNVTGGLASANNAEAQAALQGSKAFWDALANIGGAAAKGFAGAR